nr:MBL fold metallo-hydrolase RNA specificity domain-containing protein [Pseudomonas soli]
MPGAVIQASRVVEGVGWVDLGRLYEVRAKVLTLGGVSGHADQRGLLAFAHGGGLRSVCFAVGAWRVPAHRHWCRFCAESCLKARSLRSWGVRGTNYRAFSLQQAKVKRCSMSEVAKCQQWEGVLCRIVWKVYSVDAKEK